MTGSDETVWRNERRLDMLSLSALQSNSLGRYLKPLLALDLRSLAFFRIGMGLFTTVDILDRLRDATEQVRSGHGDLVSRIHARDDPDLPGEQIQGSEHQPVQGGGKGGEDQAGQDRRGG